MIRECAARVPAGESLSSVCNDLNSQGIGTAGGKPWRVMTLKDTLISARISGRREYHGDITAAGTWPAIITADASDQLRALLTRPERRTNAVAREYLLSGILRCGTCGLGMVGGNHGGRPRYVCNKAPGSAHCGKITVYADRADTEISDQIITALGTPRLARLVRSAAGNDPDAAATAAKLRSAEERREELAAAWAAGEISRTERSTARRVLDDQVAKLTRQLSRSEHGRALAEFAADHITVDPAGTKHWNPDRIKITWRPSATAQERSNSPAFTLAAKARHFHARKTHRRYLEVAAEPAAVPYARRCTRYTLAAWNLSPIAADAELVVSELLTNAVRATLAMPPTAHVVLYLAAEPGRLTLLGWDACPEPPRHRPRNDDSAGGRGLEIVQALSDRWGTCAPVQGGKVVWAWFDLDRS